MPAGAYLLGSREYLRRLRANRRALGLCRFCSQKAAPERKTCVYHLAYLKAWKARRAA